MARRGEDGTKVISNRWISNLWLILKNVRENKGFLVKACVKNGARLFDLFAVARRAKAEASTAARKTNEMRRKIEAR